MKKTLLAKKEQALSRLKPTRDPGVHSLPQLASDASLVLSCTGLENLDAGAVAVDVQQAPATLQTEVVR